ncbi:MAG: DUF3011 domain-containing protein [Candidatus Binatia bacterium]
MRKFQSTTLLFLFVLVLSFDKKALAQQDPDSLLGTILNETLQQSHSPESSPWYGHDPHSRNDYYDDRYYDARQGKRITCESRGSQYNYCRTNVRGRIRIERQLSDTPCRQYDTWGADGDGSGVWVSNGCRATFIVEPRRSEPRDRDSRKGGRERTITCESRGERHTYCRTNTYGRVRLERQLSDAPCREYYTWGADKDGGGVWVSNGCRATFVVESRGPRHGGSGDDQSGRSKTFTCKSDGFKYSYCRTGARGGTIRLVRQLSDAPCREYYTWGADRDGGGVWVDQGCSAEFSVERR